MTKIGDLVLPPDTTANQPAAGTEGRLFFQTDGNLQRDNGTTWEDYESAGGGGSGIGALLFDSTLGADTSSIDSGAGGFSTSYKVLRVYFTGRTDVANTLSTLLIRVNNDSGANYDSENDILINATRSDTPLAAQTSWNAYAAGGNSDANRAGSFVLEIPHYADTTFYKTGIITNGSSPATAAQTAVRVEHCTWRSTTAITRLAVSLASGNLKAGSRLTIFGF